MFCKWCGADITNTATKCSRCGRDVPAMSDCGGFYDLVPSAKRQTVQEVIPKPTLPKEDPARAATTQNEFPKRDAPSKGKKNAVRKNNGFQIILICLGFVVVIALLLCLNGKTGDGFSKLGQVDGRIDSISSELQQIKESVESIKESAATQPTEESVPYEPLLEEQEIKIDVSVEHPEAGSTVKTTADLGEFDDVVAYQVSFDKNTDSLSSVQIDLSESENCVEVQIENELPYSSDKGSISVEFDVDELIFAEMQDDADYEWEYRIGGSDEWIPLEELDDEVFLLSTDRASVTYSARDVVNLLDDEDAEMVEFRLTYKRDNIHNGSLTVIISGITMTNQLLTTRPYTYS